MQHILVPTDFSNNAYSALFYATQLLKGERCSFCLLNTYDHRTPLLGGNGLLLASKKKRERLKKESRDQLLATKHRIVRDTENNQHRFKVLSVHGELVATIKKELEEHHYDLIVMGNKGLTQTADIFFGSNTIQVVQALNRLPLLAVPGEMNYAPPKEIALVTDYRTGCDAETLAPLLFFAEGTRANVRVVHVATAEALGATKEANRERLEDCLAHRAPSFHTLEETDDKAKVIDHFLRTMKIDLFAMVNREKSLFERLTREPVIKDVSMYSEVPLLVLPQVVSP
ncbi:universal stress protein [Maribacter sp. 2307ULW6-5]|uniref:universal stress protein n=1 Tax=Maribacter sp. 2307ULW6-5 TaxID=3386275 RepID=UPI0039BC9186